MRSRDVFVRNVKDILSRRGLRLKDLSEGTGISPSHLSLVLNGTRFLSDDMKDKIAAFLGVSLSRLYSEEPVLPEVEAPGPLIHDPERKELQQVLDTFLIVTHMDELRRSFYVALGTLNDTEARSVKGFLKEVLRDMTGSEGGAPTFDCQVGLSREEQKFLAFCRIAGSGARLEWVKAISGLSDEAFKMLTEKLCSRSLIRLVEDEGGVRTHLTASVSVPSPRSLFTRERLHAIYLTLAQAMETMPDEGPFFQSNLAEVLLKAGMTRESIAHFEQAAHLFEKASLFENAAGCWYKSALLHNMISEDTEKYWKLCEAVRCMVSAGRREDAQSVAYSVLEELDEKGLGHLKGKVCLLVGHALLKKHPLEALEWYRRGIPVTPVNSYTHGALLGSVLATLVDLRQTEEAQDAAKALERWLLTAVVSEHEKKYIADNYELLQAIIDYWKRDWKSAKQRFMTYLGAQGCSGAQRATAMHNFGIILYREGRLDEARQYIEEAIRQSSFAEFGANRAHANVELAKIHLRAGELEPIGKLLEEAEQVLTSRPTAESGWIWLIRAAVSKQRGLHREAVAAAKRAIELFSRFGAEREEACACCWMARLLRQKADSMWDYYEHRAYAIYEKRGWDPKDLLEDTSLLEPLS
ncbi:MAG TPA: helix-turn-helix transcriptional regulator [Firmicutes bacterium]|nr:helix-turn-helix transcriptional regulator [Candidatus Fermentithermobacillaceae bacterium]